MTELICLRCGKFFVHQGSFKKHLNRINECYPNLSQKTLEEVAIHYGYSYGKKIDNMEIVNLPPKCFTCQYCNKNFTRKNNLMVHINKSCKPIIDKPINIPAFGQETIEFSNELLNKTIKNPLKGFVELMELKYINVKYTSHFYLDVFNGEFWEAKDKSEVYHNMIVSIKDTVDDYFDENEFDDKIKEKYEIFTGTLDRCLNAHLEMIPDEISKEDKEIYNKLIKQIELYLINAKRHLKK